jgi:spermidine/putrescine transport system permease protein
MKRLRLFFFIIIFGYLYLPIAILVVNAFNSNRYGLKWDGFTIKWFIAMANNAGLVEATRHSLTIAFCTATLATIIGAMAAIAFHRYRFPGRRVLQGTLMTLMMAPDIILAISLLVLFVVIGISLGFWSLVIAHITFCLPFTMVTVSARIQGFDPFLLDAAKDLGASESQLLYRVVLPILRPALFSSWLLSFTLSLDDVIVSSFVTGPSYDVLPLKIFSMVKVGVKPEVNALATIMVGLSLVFVLLSQLVRKEKDNNGHME